jgi:surface antigen
MQTLITLGTAFGFGLLLIGESSPEGLPDIAFGWSERPGTVIGPGFGIGHWFAPPTDVPPLGISVTPSAALLDAFRGTPVGLQLAWLDELVVRQAAQAAFLTSIGIEVPWRSDAAQGSVTSVRYGWAIDGALCREYRQTVTVGTATYEGSGTACLRPDGSWRYAGAGTSSTY